MWKQSWAWQSHFQPWALGSVLGTVWGGLEDCEWTGATPSLTKWAANWHQPLHVRWQHYLRHSELLGWLWRSPGTGLDSGEKAEVWAILVHGVYMSAWCPLPASLCTKPHWKIPQCSYGKHSVINSFSYEAFFRTRPLCRTYFTVPLLFYCPILIKAVTPVVFALRIRMCPWQRMREKSTGIKFQCNCLLNCGLQLLKFYPWFCVTTAVMNSAWLWFSHWWYSHFK